MTSRPGILSIVKLLALGSIIASLASCQPIGASDPLDQDAFYTDVAPVVPVDNF